ncbi:hypothetical protein C823_000758 [Eubacterium plexicaudatum ASF492]|uniref:Uncharacterized protein n=1 Tax=Eubacterium plexicaudatum ASF492 TaxID=1235802 RepID=N2A866_9FIRM|nr:hypothetical protein C823_000758 [Eubacterium plexicaudatum ASF492]
MDFIFYPETDKSADCIILELKVGHTPDEALRQVKEKSYELRFQGKTAEGSRYTGRIPGWASALTKNRKSTFAKQRLYEQSRIIIRGSYQ